MSLSIARQVTPLRVDGKPVLSVCRYRQKGSGSDRKRFVPLAREWQDLLERKGIGGDDLQRCAGIVGIAARIPICLKPQQNPLSGRSDGFSSRPKVGETRVAFEARTACCTARCRWTARSTASAFGGRSSSLDLAAAQPHSKRLSCPVAGVEHLQVRRIRSDTKHEDIPRDPHDKRR